MAMVDLMASRVRDASKLAVRPADACAQGVDGSGQTRGDGGGIGALRRSVTRSAPFGETASQACTAEALAYNPHCGRLAVRERNPKNEPDQPEPF